VVTKLDRLARSLPDARDIVEELTTRGVRLQLGGSVHDPTDPVGRLLFNVLAMVAEFKVMQIGPSRGSQLESAPLRFCEELVTPPPGRSQPLVRTTALARDA